MLVGVIALNGEKPLSPFIQERLKALMEGFESSYVIGVDGGCALLEAIELTADELIGDFDSIDDKSHYLMKWPKAISRAYPPEKNDTDSEIALMAMLEKQPERLIVIGGFGGRLDHMLGSLMLMNQVPRNIQVFFIDAHNVITWLEGPVSKRFTKAAWMGTYVSLVPVSDMIRGVTLKGVKYPLDEAVIKLGGTLGISNEMVDDFYEVTIKSGKCFLIFSSDTPTKE